MKKARIVLALTAAFGLSLSAAQASETLPVASSDLLTPVAKVDSGLGELPPLAQWREPWLYAIPAEKIDSGLGELPPLAEWREPWLHAMPAEKIDSGLGELPPLAEWREPWLHATPAEKIDSGLGDISAAATLAARTRAGAR